MEQNYQDEIDKTLDALDGIKRASPRPFFYGRLMARMEKSQDLSEESSYSFAMPKMAWAMGLCILLLNASAVIYSQNTTFEQVAENIETITDDYGWSEGNSIY